MIYQTLQQGTRARPGRRVEIVNLGLDPDEAAEMDLPAEKVEGKGRRSLGPAVSPGVRFKRTAAPLAGWSGPRRERRNPRP